jgi:hypothetical protein
MPQFGASLTDDSRGVIYNRNMFIKQGTGFFREREDPPKDEIMICCREM